MRPSRLEGLIFQPKSGSSSRVVAVNATAEDEREMDLNYAKWDRVVKEDSSGDEGGGGAGNNSPAGRPFAGASSSGCNDPTCCNCAPDNMFPDFNGAMSSMSSMMAGGPDGMSEMPPEAASMFSSMMSSEAFRGGMFGSSSPANFASFAAGIVAGDGGGRQRGQGPSTGAAGAAAATSGTEGDSDPDDDCTEPPPLDPDSSPEDGAGAGGEEGGAGKGGTGGGGGDEGDESFSSSSEDFSTEEDDDEEEEDDDDNSDDEAEVMEAIRAVRPSSEAESDSESDSDSGSGSSSSNDEGSSDGGGGGDGPPALASSSDADSDKGKAATSGTLYSEYVLAREAQPGPWASMSFWKDKKHSTSAAFTDYYVDKILRGRPVPHLGTALSLKNFPSGFPEFACCVGQMKPAKFREVSGPDAPHGFFEFCRDAASRNAKMTMSKSRLRKAKSGSGPADRTKKQDSRAAGRGIPGGGGGGDTNAAGGASMISAIQRNLESAANHRLQSNVAITGVESKMRATLKTLEQALERERKRHELELAAAKQAAVEAKEAAKAQAVEAAAAAEVRALSGAHDGSGGRFSIQEAMDRAEALKKRANTVLVDTRYPEAVEQYTLAIQVLEVHVKPAPWADQGDGSHSDSDGSEYDEKSEEENEDDDEEESEEDKNKVAARELLLILLCNRSVAHRKWGNLGSAKADAQRAIDIDPHHIKAYFRRAAAYKQAGRYREALSDLRFMLRLEPPPQRGVPVSKDILDVQKMAKECEQKVRAKGFEKALQETAANNANAAKSASEQKEAREKWDAARTKGGKKDPKSNGKPNARGGGPGKAMPLPPANKGAGAGGVTAAADYWDIVGETYLPPKSKIPSLKERSAWVAAGCIDRAPEAFVQWCEGILSEYLLCIFERLNWVSLQKMMASGLYDEVGIISSNNQTDNWQAQDRLYRELYAAVSHDDFLRASTAAASGAGRGGQVVMVGAGKSVETGGKEGAPELVSPLVLHPHLGLVDVLENHTCFTYQARDTEEEATPRLFDFNRSRSSGRAVVSRDEFFQQFNVFTEGQLTFMDWNNVVAAGGSVLAATHPPPPGPLRDFYHTLAYRSSDVDLFLYGLDEAAATEKVTQIYNAVKLANSKIYAVRSLRTVTLVSEFPFRKIQIVLRLYKTLAEVLHGFDVDCCSVGFDGHTVWATNRAARSICKRYNVVDLSRRSPSYESRLFKYGKRGHAVLVRGLEVDRIRPDLRKNKIGTGAANAEAGLAKLIAMDSSYQRFHLNNWGHYYQRWNEGLLVENASMTEAERIHNQESVRESDYTTMFLPYGPRWNRDRTRRHVMNYVASANSWYYRLSICEPAQAPITPVVCGDIDFVLSKGVNTGEGERMMYSHAEETSLMHMKHVAGDAMWVKDNPGRQGSLLTGSFNPMTASKVDWEAGVYR